MVCILLINIINSYSWYVNEVQICDGTMTPLTLLVSQIARAVFRILCDFVSIQCRIIFHYPLKNAIDNLIEVALNLYIV